MNERINKSKAFLGLQHVLTMYVLTMYVLTMYVDAILVPIQMAKSR
ncbi:xanthine/uracil permease [Peribacillus simplex]|nr:hypothetical protein [Peribacillus simplex]MDF9763069.1 xanthine/uracil permease [Peribacillus simplex]